MKFYFVTCTLSRFKSPLLCASYNLPHPDIPKQVKKVLEQFAGP